MSILTLLAQAAGPDFNPGDVPQGVLILMSLFVTGGVLITAIATGTKYATKERELQHTERLKAIEKGLLFDDVEEERRIRKGIMRLAFAIGLVVPMIAIIGATSAVINAGGPHTMTIFLIWTATAAVGVAGVASGAWLAQAAAARFSSGGRRDNHATSPYPRTYETPETAAAR